MLGAIRSKVKVRIWKAVVKCFDTELLQQP